MRRGTEMLCAQSIPILFPMLLPATLTCRYAPCRSNCSPKNYVADSPGIWRLKSGKLSKLE